MALPPREKEALIHYASGLEMKEIGAAMKISHRTAEAHLTRAKMRTKLEGRCRIQALRFCVKQGWLDLAGNIKNLKAPEVDFFTPWKV